jgi:quercetin dioxygenase-like cupin family protein
VTNRKTSLLSCVGRERIGAGNHKENKIKKLIVVLAVAAAGLIQGPVGLAKEPEKGKQKEVIYVSAESATFAEAMPGVSIAAIWGDREKGTHATFTKFAPGQDNGMHTHTNDLWIVVLKGAYLYKDDAGEKRVGPGEFIRIPGGISTGVAATRPKARSSTRRGRENLIGSPLSRRAGGNQGGRMRDEG